MKFRNEYKHHVTEFELAGLRQRLGAVAKPDKYSGDSGSYLVKSLYFDNCYDKALNEKIMGVSNREKFRIRFYNNDTSFIRLEKKMKHNNMTAKEQMLISKDIYSKILEGRLDEIEGATGLLEEFIAASKNKGLIPSIIVEYHRIAFTYPTCDVRITFDSNITSGLYDYDLFNKEGVRYPVIEKGKQVLEVKYNEALPLHIANILNDIPHSREAVSKFAICRSIK